MTTVHEFKRNNLYRIDTTDGEAFAVSVQIDDDELLELCRIIVGIERQGKTILCVRAIHAISLDEIEYRNTKEYAQAQQEPTHTVIDGKFKVFCSSGAFFVSPCKVDLNSYRVYDVEDGGECSGNDDVTEYGVSYMKNNHEEFSHVYNLSDEESDDFSPDGTVLSTLKHIRDGGKVLHYGFWCCDDDSVVTLDDSTQLVTVPRSSSDPIAELCRALVVLKRERYHIREVFKLSSDGHAEKVYWYGRSQYIEALNAPHHINGNVSCYTDYASGMRLKTPCKALGRAAQAHHGLAGRQGRISL